MVDIAVVLGLVAVFSVMGYFSVAQGPQKWFARIGVTSLLAIILLGNMGITHFQIDRLLLATGCLCFLVTAGYWALNKYETVSHSV